MKFPMAPESTMAVVLMESASVISVVKCLTSWYSVIAETTALFSMCGSESHEVAIFDTFTSAGMTASVGRSSFFDSS